MQEQHEQEKLSQNDSRPSRREPLVILLCLIAIALLLNVAAASTALNHLLPKMVGGRQGIAARVNWYLRSGQLPADARTAGATLQFVMDTERDATATTNLPDLPVAENAAPATPKS